MTTHRRAEMIADRQLRDAAKALMMNDLRNVRADLSAKSVGQRAAGRVSEGAQVVYEEAMDVASDHKGALAAILAAVVVWFARHPILQAVGLDEEWNDFWDEAPPEQDWRSRRFGR